MQMINEQTQIREFNKSNAARSSARPKSARCCTCIRSNLDDGALNDGSAPAPKRKRNDKTSRARGCRTTTSNTIDGKSAKSSQLKLFYERAEDELFGALLTVPAIARRRERCKYPELNRSCSCAERAAARNGRQRSLSTRSAARRCPQSPWQRRINRAKTVAAPTKAQRRMEPEQSMSTRGADDDKPIDNGAAQFDGMLCF